MIAVSRAFGCFAVLVAVAACSKGAGIDGARVDRADLHFGATAEEYGIADAQAQELRSLAQDLVRRSTSKGAIIGAAAGCGLNAAIAGDVTSCVPGAAMGATGGGLIGNVTGKMELEKRYALISPDAVATDLKAAALRFETVDEMMPALLAHYDGALDSLYAQYSAGSLTEAQYRDAVAVIREDRSRLAVALSVSGRDFRRTARNLEAVRENGQEGLDWHIDAAHKLADDVDALRSGMTLL
ncbi:MAG: hypothetical protein AAFO93_15465 [Pseudomonadota bacterium]